MITIENDVLTISVNEQGAELSSIYHKQNCLEYLWSGDPLFWAKRSPVLFPIVGSLKENKYYFNGRPYEMSRHGFGRESLFKIKDHAGPAISFVLISNAETLEKFPFDFQFLIRYQLDNNMLGVSYEISNEGDEPLYFSVGGHPAFKVPLVESTGYEDYFLEFSSAENAGRWPVSKDGLIEENMTPLLTNTNHLPLTKHLFSEDALVFKHLASKKVSIKSFKTTHGIEFDFTGFPYLGIWAAKNADFVCIEPWCGIADSVNSNQQLTEKEGINKLEKGMLFTRTWKAAFY